MGRAEKTGPRRTAEKRGPGRPTAVRVEAINQALLDAARDEFYRIGYEGARVDTIAAAAGVSKATLYDRYPTKEALLLAVVAKGVTSWLTLWDPEGTPPSLDARQRLKYRARKLMKWYCSGRLEPLERLFSSGSSMQELRLMRHEVGHKRIVETVRQDVIDASADPDLSPRAAATIAEMLLALVSGWWRAHKETGPVKTEVALAFADRAVDVLLDGRAAWPQAGLPPQK